MVHVSDLKGRVDFGIITVRDDEFRALLKRFPMHDDVENERRYVINYLPANNGNYYSIALVTCIAEGNGEGQRTANDLISDLDPNWILLVGIGGGVPESEFTLGDVIAATRLQDFSISANQEKAEPEYDVRGAPMHRNVTNFLSHLIAIENKIEAWNTEVSIGMPRPSVQLLEENYYGDPKWKAKVKKVMERHFGDDANRRPPKFTTGAIASSDQLQKNSQTMQNWLKVARKIYAVEMELAGVYLAAQKKKSYPVLAIRGISDIVGFERDPAWTEYACQSAASFAYHLLKTGLVIKQARDSNFAKQQLLGESTENQLAVSRFSYLEPIFQKNSMKPNDCIQLSNALEEIKENLVLDVKHRREEYLLKKRASMLNDRVNEFKETSTPRTAKTDAVGRKILGKVETFLEDVLVVEKS
jgi:nucleoside phosphorylase